MSFPGGVRRPLACLLLVSTLGCYTYVPLEGPDAEPGDEIRVHIRPSSSGPAREDPLRAAPAEPIPAIEGRVLLHETERVVLSVRRAERRGVERFGSRQDTLSVPLARIESVEKQEFSLWRTGILAGATAGGVFLALVGLLDTGGGSGPSDGGRDPL